MLDTDFKNSDRFPPYEGNFTIELAPGATIDNLPHNTSTIDERDGSFFISVTSGKITQDVGNLQFRDHQGNPFYWSYDRIIAIRDQDGNPLWLNDAYRPKPKFKMGQRVKIVRLLDATTTRELIGKEGNITEIDPLANGEFNYRVGDHYMHEGELEEAD